MSSRAGEQTLGGGCPEKCSANRDPDAPRTRSDASRHAVTRRAAESFASQAPKEVPTGSGVMACEPRVGKTCASWNESPPDRFLRAPGFEGSTWRTAGHTAQTEAPEALCDGRLVNLVLEYIYILEDEIYILEDEIDDRRRAHTPPRERESAARMGVGGIHAAELHRRSMQAVATAQEAGERDVNTRSRGSRVDSIARTPFSSSSMAPLSRSSSTLRRYVTSSRAARPRRQAPEQETAAQPTFAVSSLWDDCCEDTSVSALWPYMLMLAGIACLIISLFCLFLASS